MNRLIQCKVSFPVDIPSFIDWGTTTFASKFQGVLSSKGMFRVVVSDAFSSDDENTLKNYVLSLTPDGEAAKMALPSRLEPAAKAARNQQIKAVLATKTWDQLTEAQRRFVMGGSVSNAEYDALPIS